MKTKMRLIVVLAFMMLLMSGVTSLAENVQGEGRIRAKGVGTAVVRGTGKVEIRVQGVAVIYVKGASDLVASGSGFRKDLEGGGVFLAGWKGKISVVGEEMVVAMRGGTIEFSAIGTGSVYLKGRGEYEIDGDTDDWSLIGTSIQLGDPVEYAEAESA